MAPPPPPLPKMEGLYFLMNASKDSDNPLLDSPEKQKVYQASPSGKKIRKAETDCVQLQKQLELSQQAWRDLQEIARKNPNLKTITEEEVHSKQHAIRAHAWQYKLCLANSLCPRQCQLFGSCWKFAGKTLGEKNMRGMLENRVLDGVCQPERDIILRCVGREVASAVTAVSSLESGDDVAFGIEDDPLDFTANY